MIRNDYIYDHNMILPDICDFPEAGGSLYPAQINFDHVENIRKYFNEYDFNNFVLSWNNMINDILAFSNFTPSELKILKEQNSRIFKSVKIYFDSCINQTDRSDIPATNLYNELNEKGCSGFLVDQQIINEINSVVHNDVQELLKIPDHNANPHNYDRFKSYKNTSNQNLYSLINEIFNDYDVFQAVSKYNRMSKNLSLNGISLQVSTPTDTHHYMTLRDLKTTSKLVSLHMDPKYNLMKAILYLNDVNEENGPFTTIPGSNKWGYDQLERLVACGISTGNYLDTPEKRKVLRHFPTIFRKNVIVGRYILDDTELSNQISDMLYTWTTDKANCIIFDPTQTFHRGGLCKSGYRINLQILMR